VGALGHIGAVVLTGEQARTRSNGLGEASHSGWDRAGSCFLAILPGDLQLPRTGLLRRQGGVSGYRSVRAFPFTT